MKKLILKIFLGDKKDQRVAATVFAILLSTTTWIGNALYADATMRDNLSSGKAVVPMLLEIFWLTLLAILLFNIIVYIADLLFLQYRKKEKETKLNSKVIFVGCAAILFLCWLPIYFAFYPGCDSYDYYGQIIQITGEVPYGNAHPICHTMLLKLCYLIGDIIPIANFGLVIYSLMQMAVMAMIFSYAFLKLKKCGMGRYMLIVLLAFFAVCPTIVLFMFSPTKDVLFSGFFLLWILNIVEMLDDKENVSKRNLTELILWGILGCLFRSNAILPIAITMLFMFFAFKKQWKKVLIAFCAICGTYVLLNMVILPTCNILGNPATESLAVPMNQIAAVASSEYGNYTQEEYELAWEYFPKADTYNPRLADVQKWSFNKQLFEEDENAFYSLWFELMKENPGIYTEAFLNLNLEMWYVNNPFPDKYANRWYIDVGEGGLDGRDWIPSIKSFYTELAHFPTWLKQIPVISWFFSLSAPIWITFTCELILLLKRQRKLAFVSLPILIFWISYLFGAVSCFRYMFPIVVFLPFYIALIVLENRK